ncbi:MAG TPA: nitrile hydratase accessory protein [Caulobacteraceae bacterium]|nr:nitrile hydratase accessory protein [Caulobacteraceae bacterium]
MTGRDAAGPAEPAVFDEPWQAEAFALVVHLERTGAFSWSEWTEALAAEIAAAGPAADGARYYEQWLAALEGLVTRRGLAASEALAERKQAWARAYERTPHGQPVTLS